MTRSALALACLLAAAIAAPACAPTEPPAPGEPARPTTARQPILGGTVDASTTGVVAVLGETFLCSGSLLAPNLVLTARHCVANILQVSDSLTCSDSFGPASDASTLAVTDATHAEDGPFVGVRDVFVRSEDGLCDNDVAILVLDDPDALSAVTPLVPRIDARVRWGDAYTAIGYGNPRAGTRRRLDGREVVCLGSACGDANAIVLGRTDWVGDGGVCPGDSGGPAIDEHGRVIGVASRADEACEWGLYAGVANIADWLRDLGAYAAEVGEYTPPYWVTAGVSHPPGDPDFDGTAEPDDNCPDVANPDQRDVDSDGVGDVCDPFNDAPRGGDCPVCDACLDDSDCVDGSSCVQTESGAWCTYPCAGVECPFNTVCAEVGDGTGGTVQACVNDDWASAGVCDAAFLCLDRVAPTEDTAAPDTGPLDAGGFDSGTGDIGPADGGTDAVDGDAAADVTAPPVVIYAPREPRGCGAAPAARPSWLLLLPLALPLFRRR